MLAGISALIYLIYFFKGRKSKKMLPIGVHYLRFVATVDLVITFLVVGLFLGFITDEGYFSLFVNVNFLFHFAIPVLSFISFVFFENAPKFKFYCTFIGVSHLIWYIIFYLATVLNNYDNGYISIKYDWYAFAQKGLGVSLICAVIVFGIGYLTSFILYKYKLCDVNFRFTQIYIC